MRFWGLSCSLFLLAPVLALASPLPQVPLAPNRIGLSEAGGDYKFVDLAFQNVPSKINAQYWGAVLKNCEGTTPEQAAKDIYELWISRMDPGRHVLFVVCKTEGVITAHTGTQFTFLGMTGEALGKELMKASDVTMYLKQGTEAAVLNSQAVSEDKISEVLKTRAELRAAAVTAISQAEGAILGAKRAITDATQGGAGVSWLPGFGEEEANKRLAEAKLWLDASPTQAQTIAQEIVEKATLSKKRADEAVVQNREISDQLELLKVRLKKGKAELPITMGEDKAATDAFLAAESELSEAESSRGAGDYEAAKKGLTRAQKLLALGEEATREGNIIRRGRVIYAPLALIVFLALAAFIAAIGFKKYAEAWGARALGALDTYGSRIADLAGRLDSLRLKYPALTLGHELHDRYWNDTLKRYESAGEKYDRLTALIGKARQLIIRARDAARLPHPFAVAPSRTALRILHEGNCEVQYGPGLSQIPVMLKSNRTYITKISSLLDEIALSLPTASRELEELNALFEDAGPAAKQAKEAVEKAQSLYRELSGLGVVPTSAQVELSSLNAAAASLGSDLEHDPSVVVKRARLIQESAQLMATRLSSALGFARKACEELPAQVRALWVKVYELRQQGFKLREAAFEPETLKERLDRTLSAALTALGALDLDRAQKELAGADEAQAALREGIKASVQSKEMGPKDDASLRARIEAFQERLSQERPALDRTLARAEKAVAKDLTEQIERAPIRISRISQLISEAERRAQEGLYLAAAERRVQATQQLKALEDLLNDIRDGDKLEALVNRPSGTFSKVDISSSGIRSIVNPPKPGSSDSSARVATPLKLPTVSESMSKSVPSVKSAESKSDPNVGSPKPPKSSPSNPEWKAPPEAAQQPTASQSKLQVQGLKEMAVQIAAEAASRGDNPSASQPPQSPSTKKLAPLIPPKPPKGDKG